MRITLVRNATLIVELAGKRILVDPMLDDAGVRPPIEGTANPVRNPTVPLPFPAEDVVAGIDAVIVTHRHRDHLDARAEQLLAARRARLLPAGGRGGAPRARSRRPPGRVRDRVGRARDRAHGGPPRVRDGSPSCSRRSAASSSTTSTSPGTPSGTRASPRRSTSTGRASPSSTRAARSSSKAG